MFSTRQFKNNLENKKHKTKTETIKNKNVFNYKNDKVSNKEKNKVITKIKKK